MSSKVRNLPIEVMQSKTYDKVDIDGGERLKAQLGDSTPKSAITCALPGFIVEIT